MALRARLATNDHVDWRADRATVLSWPLVLFVASFAATAAFVAYLTMAVPVQIPTLPDSEEQRYWPAAIAAGALVLAVVLAQSVRAVRRVRRQSRAVRHAAEPTHHRAGLPAPLDLHDTSWRAACLSAAASLALLTGAVREMLPLWGIALAVLLPWLPVLAYEVLWKRRSYGLFSAFLLVALLQTGHLGEHAAQVTQLLMTDGDLARSRGVFGQLDFETVHFFWDTTIWLTTFVVLLRFNNNWWLWASFIFASLHETEHVYLYWVFLTDYDYYMRGGLAGIMGKGGVIGSPLARPYLHFMYNFLVTLPMLIGLWQQAGEVEADAAGR